MPAMITEELEEAILNAADEMGLSDIHEAMNRALDSPAYLEPQVAVGDKVITRIHAGAPLDWGGYSEFADLVTVREDEILALIED